MGIGKVAAGEAAFFILLVDEIAGFVSNHDFAAGPGDAQYFPDGARFVVEKVDAANVKDDVETVVPEGEGFGIGMH